MSRFTALIPKPAASDINTGLSCLSQSFMMQLFGAPGLTKTTDCGPLKPALQNQMVTKSVGPFKVTGHCAAVASLEEVLADVKGAVPELYNALGTAGMLCCRLVRGSDSNWSNHSWGFAVDITIAGELDRRGDNLIQSGLLALYPFFHRHGWWWGAEFGVEDAMHFEVAQETLTQWARKGQL